MAVSILNTDVPPTSSWEHYHLIIQEELENLYKNVDLKLLEGRDWRQGGEPIQSGLNKSLDNLLLSQIPLVESES